MHAARATDEFSDERANPDDELDVERTSEKYLAHNLSAPPERVYASPSCAYLPGALLVACASVARNTERRQMQPAQAAQADALSEARILMRLLTSTPLCAAAVACSSLHTRFTC